MQSSTSFLSFSVQVSELIQFMIKNCYHVFGNEITSLLAENSVSCDSKEDSSGIVNNWVVVLCVCVKETRVCEDAGTVVVPEPRSSGEVNL